MIAGAITREAIVSFQLTANMMTTVATTCAPLQSDRVTSSVTTVFAFAVSFMTRAMT